MVTVIEDRMDAICEACERFHVVSLDVFGSMSPYDKPDAYFGLLDELRAILGAEVDLVMVGALKNRSIRENVNRTKQQLYAA